MTAVAISIGLQAIALALVWHSVRARPAASFGLLFLAVAFVYHGLTEFARAVFGTERTTAALFADSSFESAFSHWMVFMGIAFVIYAATFRLTVGKVVFARASTVHGLSRSPLGWKRIAIIGIGLDLILIFSSAQTAPGYWLSGLAQQFTVMFCILAAIRAVEQRAAAPERVALFLALVLTPIGSRLTVVASVLILVGALSRAGSRFSLVRATKVAIVCVAAISTISLSRTIFDRSMYSDPIGERVAKIAASLAPGNIYSGARGSWQDFVADTIDRLDGNTYGALILSRLEGGYPAPGLGGLLVALNLNIPRFLNPTKLDVSYEKTHEEAFINSWYDFPRGYDFGPTLFVMIASYYGPWSLLFGAAIFGASLGCADRWLLRSRSLAAIIVGYSISSIALFTEQGMTFVFWAGRGALIGYWFLRLLSVGVRRRDGFCRQPLVIGPAIDADRGSLLSQFEIR